LDGETVPNFIAASDTGLKPGVNDRLHFRTFEAKAAEANGKTEEVGNLRY
jgi:hypothetical protein